MFLLGSQLLSPLFNTSLMHSDTALVFFGTPHLSVIVLDALHAAGIVPTLIITAPDKPVGRGMQLTPPPVKRWADEHGIPTLQPQKIDADAIAAINDHVADYSNTLFVVVAYGKILPKTLLDIPNHGTLNVHPSLLPKWRGPSPVRTGILNNDDALGVTVMLLDEEMDHGPILAQELCTPEHWPMSGTDLEHTLFSIGGTLLAETIPPHLAGTIAPQEQDHEAATYSKLFKKEDGEINLNDDGYTNMLKFCAYDSWPGVYFFADDGTRVKIAAAHLENENHFVIDEVIPEGKQRMPYTQFVRA